MKLDLRTIEGARHYILLEHTGHICMVRNDPIVVWCGEEVCLVNQTLAWFNRRDAIAREKWRK